MRRLAAILIAVVLVVASAAAAEAPRKLAIAEVAPIAISWPSFVGEERGIFARHGVDPVVTYVGSTAAAVQQTVGGSYDIGSTTVETAVRAIVSGAPVVIIGSPVLKYPYAIMVDPAIHGVADLKGRVVMLSGKYDIPAYAWNHWVASQGMQPTDIDQVYDGATPNRFAALASHAAQAAMLTQPYDFRAAHDGFAKLLDLGAYMTRFGFTALVARPQWLHDNGDAARAYLAGQAEAIAWIEDPANRAAAIEILARRTKQDPAFAAQTYDFYIANHEFNRSLEVPASLIANAAAALVEMGQAKSTDAVPAGAVDMRYLPR
jgi:ABC-type nitrate/sulfonate/bicarbonate transport system substrate-binding protein